MTAMRPPFTYVYPYKTLIEVEAPQYAGQRTAVRSAGDWRDAASYTGVSGLGGNALTPFVFGYAAYYACKNGYLPASDCADYGIPPGTVMPGTCPDTFKLDGQCVCPAGSELEGGGCAYPDGYLVDKDGALPIGGSADGSSKSQYGGLLLGAALVAGMAALVISQKEGRRNK